MAWEYEPREFAVEWDDQGEPVKFFRPDFYLPEEDQFIEITTMNQKLVTKKNGKVRKLRKLYPDVNCKIFYQRDYLSLLVKYGLEEAIDDSDLSSPVRIPGPPQLVDLGLDENDEAAG